MAIERGGRVRGTGERAGIWLEVEGTPYRVCPGVYFPADDTYLLIDAMARDLAVLARDRLAWSVLDVGSGTGVVSLFFAAVLPNARVVAVDVGQAASRCAKSNLSRRGVGSRAFVVRGSLLGALRPGATFNLVAFNPPYLPSDERDGPADEVTAAWDGGPTGVELTAKFLDEVAFFLAPAAKVYLVASSLANLAGVEQAAAQNGLDVEIVAREHFFFEDLVVYRLVDDRAKGE
ncbi:MAG: class I SAM-dependent methyltransferase [Promethearchaeota archaeon]